MSEGMIARACSIEADYAAAMAKHYADLEKNRSEVLAQVALLVSPRKMSSIEEFIDYCDDSIVCDFELTETHGGERQDEPGTAFRYVYIDQRSGGCPSGDDYYGWVWIPLPKGKFLKYHYA